MDMATDRNLLKKFGKTVRACRKHKMMTQEMLGGKAGICPKYLGEIERGETNPSLTIIFKLALALEENIADLFDIEMCPSQGQYLDRITALLTGREDTTLVNVLKVLKILLNETEKSRGIK